jgi:biotin carboxyl carrier protein
MAAMEVEMKKYNITVNGEVYAVEVEEVGAPSTPSAPAPASAQSSQTRAQEPPPKTTPAPAPQVAPSAGATVVECPMPGTVLDVLVAPGQSVKSGETLLVLEAMKMENEIVAPEAGVVDAVMVSKGASVNAGDTLVTLI